MTKPNNLVLDASGNPLNGFAPDPDKDTTPQTVEAAATLEIDVTNWKAISFRATGDVTCYLNEQDTKYYPYDSDEWHIEVIDTDTIAFNITNPGAGQITVYYRGM